MKAKSIKGNSTEEIHSAMQACMVDGYFFCYGEFGKSTRGKHEYHNKTCCVVVLKEK